MEINEFKPINSPYFGEVGLTSTSADTIANRVKHLYEAVESELNATNFVESKFGLIGTPEEEFSLETTAKKSCTAVEFVSKLEFISECKSFIAFLREAIKEKDRLIHEVGFYKSPELSELKSPVEKKPITEAEIINQMTVKEREHYLSLETRAAVYGKFIHPDNPLDKAIKDIEKALAHPRTVDYNGRDTIITLKTPKVDLDTVNSLYMDLQYEHRKAESELNGIKHSIEEKITADRIQKARTYKEEYQLYFDKFQDLRNKDAFITTARRKEIEALKIVIPKRFEALYNKVK